MSDQPFSFGHCDVSPGRRELKRDGKVISLGSRCFDILLTLASKPGQIVSKDELITRVWQGRIVEENSLESQMSRLRQALGSDRKAIRTVAGRGYQLVADTSGLPAGESAIRVVDLPARRSRLIGRDSDLRELEEMAATCRLITLTGAGGVGKTSLAIELARRLAARFPDRVCIAELAPVTQAEFVLATVASALGLVTTDGDISVESIIFLNQSKRVVLVLDNCEHLIEASAAIVDVLLRTCPFLQIIATGREPLRIGAEQVYRVAPLDVPDAENDDVADVMSYSAIELFEARLCHGQIPSAMDPRSVALKIQICRRLDGIPLAIELAAARVEVFGVVGVAERLGSMFEGLLGGNRSALPRQQTLSATLDWSYGLLPAEERAVLLGLSVFAGEFSLESAIAVISSAELPSDCVIDSIINLVYKSLVVPNTAGLEAKYRLPEMTRVYARRKSTEGTDMECFLKRHARYFCHRLQAIDAKGDFDLPIDALLDDVRAAIQWSFSENGDVTLGTGLTAALPCWMKRLLIEECQPSVGLVPPNTLGRATEETRAA
jgi:predicted ATPase/DNA-binding winged helix-turn-helix (wHTH) protein